MEGQGMKQYNLSLIFYPQRKGGYTVVCPELRACFSDGDTIEEAEANIMELITEFLPEQTGDSDESKEFFREGLCLKGKLFKDIDVETTDTGEVRLIGAKAATAA
jgi:predicted RNase H-like HicB family nuclease